MGYWEQQSQPGSSQGKTSGASDWSWLTGSKLKQWEADPNAYKPGELSQQEQGLQSQGIAQAGAGYDPNAANIDAARGLQASGRGGLLGSLQAMQSRGLQSPALAAAMTRAAAQQNAGSMAAQAAQGRYNPNAARAAIMQGAGAGQNMAMQSQQQALAASMQEQAARDATLTQGYMGLDAQDVARLRWEQQQRSGDQSAWNNQQTQQRGWVQQGMSRAAMDQAARMAYEQAKAKGYMGETTAGEGGQIIGALASAAGAASKSDVRLKHHIRPAVGEARSLLRLLAKEG